MIPSNLISKGCVRRDGVHHGGEFSANGNRMSRKRGRRELEKARGIYATNRNLPEVPLYSLPSSLFLSRLAYPSKRCVSARVNSFSATVGEKRGEKKSVGR